MKPQYRWINGELFEFVRTDPFESLPPPLKGTYIADWDDYAERWTFTFVRYGDLPLLERIWTAELLPPPFRAALLLLGIP